MSLSIEDILRGHGIGSGGGLQIVKSETEPTTGLSEGLLWYHPTEESIKIYIGGKFQSMGGGGGVAFTSSSGHGRTATVTNELVIPSLNVIPALDYNPVTDILLVSQNGTVITEGVDYTINKAARKIVKVSGSWNTDTGFGFTTIIPTPIKEESGLATIQLHDHVTVAQGVTQVAFSIPQYNPVHDLLEVHQRNLKIFKDVDWTLAPSGGAIVLKYTLDSEEQFQFTVTKKIREAGSADASTMTDHVSAAMPHIYVDQGKTYRWGFRTLNGKPQFIREEVI